MKLNEQSTPFGIEHGHTITAHTWQDDNGYTYVEFSNENGMLGCEYRVKSDNRDKAILAGSVIFAGPGCNCEPDYAANVNDGLRTLIEEIADVCRFDFEQYVEGSWIEIIELCHFPSWTSIVIGNLNGDMDDTFSEGVHDLMQKLKTNGIDTF